MEGVDLNIASRHIQRRILLLSALLLGVLFAVTAALARTYHVREERLVRQWFRQGNADLTAGRPATALEDFRNALSFDPENDLVRLRLAEALLADDRLPEAREYFLNLWEQKPGSGEVNLGLAQLSAHAGNVEEAIHYYRSAVNGGWDEQPAQQRRKVRLELCEFLLANGRLSDAQAELAGLAADAPPEEGILHADAANLFLKVGDPARAEAEFESALQTNPRQAAWLEQAGQAAYEAGDYLKAESYLARAVRENPSSPMGDLLGTIRDILSADPFRAGLTDEEQARRSWRALQQARDRLAKCMGSNSAGQKPEPAAGELEVLTQNMKGFMTNLNPQSLEKRPELRQDAMHLVFQMEDSTSRACGPPAGMDQALLLIGKTHAGNAP